MTVLVPGSTPEVRRQATFRVWLLNLLFATAVGANYLWHVPEVEGPKMWLFALPALVSTALLLTIVPGGLFWYVARFFKSPRALGWIQGGFWTLFQVVLFADTRVFNMFDYHMNSQVWNIILVRGSEDAIHLGWQVWTSVSTGLACVIVLQVWYWRRSLVRVEDKLRTGGRTALARPWYMTGAVLLPAVFLEKSLYAHADLNRDRQVTHLARIFPLYPRLPMEDLASSVLGVESYRPPKIEVDGIALDYPHARPAVDPVGPRPNVLVLAIDCLRADRLTESNMPNVAAFAEKSRVFEDHVAAGNSTRFGLFSLIYGLHGSYWFPVLNERASPVLIDTLKELDYEFGIFGSASMGYPEMRDTLWSAVEDSVQDDFGTLPPWQRDELAADAVIDWLESCEDSENPFFGFLLLDSPHQTYSHPPEATPFEPSAPELDYMSMTQNEGPEPDLLVAVENRYDNAVHHADAVTGRILDALGSSKRFENTIVVITGDHGEEFYDSGFFGHTSAFTPAQVHVPFVMRGPGVEPGVESGPTSHLDFAPTLLEMLGANPQGRESWTLGENLFEPRADRRRVFGGWNVLGVWGPEGILRVPLSLFEFDILAFDYDWNLIQDDEQVLQREAETLDRLGAECRRFLR